METNLELCNRLTCNSYFICRDLHKNYEKHILFINNKIIKPII